MSLELINTLGTLLTVAIVAATATAALIQLRHMRTSNQIKAMLSIGDRFEDDTFQRAQDIVTDRLEPLLEHPAFRQYHTSHGGGQSSHEVDPQFVEVRLAAIRIGNSFEELGILVKKGIVDKTLFVDRYCLIVTRNWNCLERFTALSRDVTGSDALWENFEYLTVLSQDWMREHPSAYPKGVRRLSLQNPWPIAPARASE